MGAGGWGWGMGLGNGELGWRDVRRSGFREAYRRMSFLTIETELYRAGKFFNFPSNPRNDEVRSPASVL